MKQSLLCALLILTTVSIPEFASAAGLRIGVLNKGRGVVWEKTEEGYREASSAAGAEIVVKTPPSATAAGAQVKLLEVLAKEKLDALIIAPIDPERLAEPVKVLASSGVKIVSIDTPLANGLAQTFVSHDQQGMATAAAKAAAELVSDGDEIAILRFTQTDRALIERETYLIKELKALRPGAKIAADVYSSSSDSQVTTQAKNLLDKHPGAKVVITTTFGATKYMVRTLRERNAVGKIRIVGFGIYLPEEMAAAIDEGLIHAWIVQKPKDLGSLSVKAAISLIKGESVPANIHPEFLVVTKQNLKNPEIQELLKENVPDTSKKPADDPASKAQP
jgi:ribose transport system substrate-binding protein